MTESRRTVLKRTALVGGSALAAGCLRSGPTPEEQLRSAAESFDELRSVDRAIDAGYRAAAVHVRTDNGGLGEVFFDQEQPLGPGPNDLDPERPQLLFFRLTENGRYKAAGVGWTVAAETVDEPPTLFDTPLTDETSDQIPILPDHYGLNAWVFEDHPDGPFAPFHPDLTGPSYVDELETARSALAPFHESGEATDKGYTNTEKHVFDEAGLYGVPFVDPEATALDLKRPPIVLYRMTDQWYYELLGVEWYVPADEVDEPPELFAQRFHDPLPGHSPKTDQPEHFGLHAWLFRANADGMFALFNPRFE